MPRHLLVLTLPLLLAVGACTTAEPDTAAAGPDTTASAPDAAASPTPPTTGTPGTAPPPQPGCNAEAARNVVGQLASTQMVEQARSAAGAQTARTLKPGQMVTMEYNASRLNIDVDAGNTITNVRCG
jgi:peptidase inhibitor I78 family protein